MKLVTNWWRYDPIPATNITRQYKIHRCAVRTMENEKNVSVEVNKTTISTVTYNANWWNKQWNWPQIDGDMIKFWWQRSRDNMLTILRREKSVGRGWGKRQDGQSWLLSGHRTYEPTRVSTRVVHPLKLYEPLDKGVPFSLFPRNKVPSVQTVSSTVEV
jgi:hypothetical protein